MSVVIVVVVVVIVVIIKVLLVVAVIVVVIVVVVVVVVVVMVTLVVVVLVVTVAVVVLVVVAVLVVIVIVVVVVVVVVAAVEKSERGIRHSDYATGQTAEKSWFGCRKTRGLSVCLYFQSRQSDPAAHTASYSVGTAGRAGRAVGSGRQDDHMLLSNAEITTIGATTAPP
jgi:hypothetical protein